MPAKSTNRRKRRLNRQICIASGRTMGKGGRPREEGVLRTPSGRKSRSAAAQRESQRQITATALNARMRHTGLKTKEATQPFAGSVLGLLHFDGHLKARELKAGEHYAQMMARHYALAGIAFPSVRAQNLSAVKGHAGEETQSIAEATVKAARRAQALDGILLSSGPRGEMGQQIRAKVYEVCLLDDPRAREWNKYTKGLVAKGLSAIADAMGWE